MSGPANEQPDLSGTTLGRYRLVRRLGMGGMGAVYLGQHELLERQAAVKVLEPTLAAKPVARKRFLREARAASKVKHPGVVEIFDVAFAGNDVYFVMELLKGRDLAERLKVESRVSWAQAQPILVQVAEALAAAHEVGVIHRDVKPSNCFLVANPDGSDGPVKVVDFGIAKVAAGDRSVTEELTTTGEVFGTVGYMPPEMAQGIHDEPRSDIYELGVMMFRMLTGRLPFLGAPLEVIALHIAKPPPRPRSLVESIPEDVERIILRAMEKDPADRQPSMRQMVAALQRAGAGAAPRSSGRTERAAKPTAGRSSGPAMPMTGAEVIDLDERPAARRSIRADDPWREEHARTTAYGEEPPPPPMPGEPDLPPELFRPREDTRLELELDHRDSTDTPRPSSGSTRRLLVGLGVVGVLAAGATVAWSFREPITEAVSEDLDELEEAVGSSPEDGAQGEPILLLVDTVPKDARVYIDDQWRTERPIRVPRSEEYLRVRVEADGYEPRTIQVQPLRTRRLEVKLDRAGKKSKKRSR